MTEINLTEPFTGTKKIVKTVREFCSSNKERGQWPSSESALRAIIQQGAQSPFDPAILRYNRRVLVDQAEWDACLTRLQKAPSHQSSTQEDSNVQNIPKSMSKKRAARAASNAKSLV